jgi:HlyD family secretion protein
MSKRVWLLIVVLAVGAVSIEAYRRMRSTPEVQLLTARVTRGSIVQTVTATGALQAVTTVQVGTQVSGTVMELGADFNSVVRKGQVIARLDPSLFQAQVAQARANLLGAQSDVAKSRTALNDARTKLDRADALSRKQLIAQADLDAARVAVDSAQADLQSNQSRVVQAQASLQQAEVNLEHTVITAPIDGTVVARNVDVGQTVAASLQSPTLFVIAADLSKMQVNANIDESDIGRVASGQAVHFDVDAFPGENFTGRVSQVRLEPQTVQNVVTYSTVIDVPNPELKLKPGMTATVTIETARRDDVLRVPLSAVRFKPTPEVFAALDQEPPADAAGWRPEAGSSGGARAAGGQGNDGRGAGGGTFAPGQAGGQSGRPVVGTNGSGDPARTGGRPSRGELWVYSNNTLEPARVTLGLSDGANVEIVSGDVQPGADVATGVAARTAAAASAGVNPLMGPQRRPPAGRGR